MVQNWSNIPVPQPSHADRQGYDNSHIGQEEPNVPPHSPRPAEQAPNQERSDEQGSTNNPETEARYTDPTTPTHLRQSNEHIPQTLAGKINTVDIAQLENQMQIDGHSLSAEDHMSRAHILYNLSNLNSLPRRSSSTLTYLKASQRRLRREQFDKPSEDEAEIQSRIQTTENRIANVPIQLTNKFQIPYSEDR